MHTVCRNGLGAVALLGVVLMGCGGDPECGAGAKLDDGKCVSASSTSCGEGTELVDGRCVPTSSEVACGEGTHLVEGECVPVEGDVECGEGTLLVDGRCVPAEGDVECGEGTIFVDGKCVPTEAEVECGEGTALVEGKCVPASEVECGEETELVAGRCELRCGEEEVRQDDGICRPICDEEGSPFGGGDGTWASPYRICAVSHFLEVRNHLDKDFVMTKSLDLSEIADFAPMGGWSEGEGFHGRFDGAGHELVGLTIQRPDEATVGLFRIIGVGGAVRNLGLVEFHVTGLRNVGTLAGISLGTIDSVHASGEVTGSTFLVGGLVGKADGPIRNSHAAVTSESSGGYVGGLAGDATALIENSHATGKVTGAHQVGGLVGRTYGVIRNSHAEVTVEGKGNNVGGLAGLAYARVENSHAKGAVTGTTSESVGGLVGLAYASISNSYATGAVTGNLRVGGLAGHLGPDVQETGFTIENCHASGDVTGTGKWVGGLVGWAGPNEIRGSHARGKAAGLEGVGGLVGYSGERIADSFATGDVESTGAFAGGLVGLVIGDIERAYATGNVSGTDQVGGLAGESSERIEDAYATGTVTGETKVGGLVGFTSGELERCYAIGVVTGTIQVGAISGANSVSATTTSCFFLEPEEGSDLGDALAEPLPPEAFGNMDHFVDWDFEETWVMQPFDAPAFMRPTLRSIPESP